MPIEIEKSGKKSWTVVERDEFGNVVRVDKTDSLAWAEEMKDHWLQQNKEDSENRTDDQKNYWKNRGIE